MEQLTDEQRAFWDEIGWSRDLPQATEGQTAEQALAFVVASIRYAYRLDGYDVPSEEAVVNELQGGSGGDALDKLSEKLGLDSGFVTKFEKGPLHGGQPAAKVEEALHEEEFGEFAPEEIPVDEWIPHPVSDSADYLDRPDPTYEDEGAEPSE